MAEMNHPTPVLALDTKDPKKLREWSDLASSHKTWVKVGLQALTEFGPELISELAEKDLKVFADVKLHDIPNTVAMAVKAWGKRGASMINIHGCGGRAMLQAAREAVEALPPPRPLLLAVTVLTSLDDLALQDMGLQVSSATHAMRLAEMSREERMDGVVCSVWESATIHRRFGQRFHTLCPGIRLKDGDSGDQKRVATPRDALIEGANFAVLGRAVTAAKDPSSALSAILSEWKS